MDRVLLDEVIYTDYEQFDLAWAKGVGFDGDLDRFFGGRTTGSLEPLIQAGSTSTLPAAPAGHLYGSTSSTPRQASVIHLGRTLSRCPSPSRKLTTCAGAHG
jgi:hypothetical protein